MSESTENQISAALTIKVPQKVGWAVQRGDKSWSGKELVGLVECFTHESDRPMTLSLSLIFEFDGNDGTVRM